MQILVTGAAGVVGRAVVRAAVRRGYETTALVRDCADPRVPRGRDVRIVAWDLERADALDGAIQEGGVVVHAAAFIPPNLADARYAPDCFRLNALATVTLIEAARRASARRVIYLSGGALYRPLGRPSREEDPLYPGTLAPYYLMSKLAGEILGAGAAERLGMELTIARIASVYGPGMRESSAVVNFLRAARAGLPLTVRSDQHTDFVYADDVADAVIAAAVRPEPNVYNVASGQVRSIADLARAAISVTGSLSSIEIANDGTSSNLMPALDIARTRAELDFAPRDLLSGLRDMLVAEAGNGV